MNLRQVLATLRAAWWVPVVSMLLAGLAALCVTMLMTPKYTASTQLFIAPAQAAVTGDPLSGSQVAEQRVPSYAQLLTSADLAQRVIDRLQLKETPTEVLDGLTATALPNTLLIDVTATADSPQKAQQIAAAVDAVFPQMVTQLETANGQIAPVTATVVNAPNLPTAPSSPQRGLDVAIACLAGLMLGVAAVIVRERLDRSVKDLDQVEGLSGAPVIGMVVHQRQLESQHLLGGGTTGPGEDFREIRTNLQFLSVDAPPHTIMIASALPAEGKTTLAVNLAHALAGSHRKVLVLEADLRRPKLTRYLGLVGGTGLTNILAGAAEAEDVVQQCGAGGFSVIAAGQTPPNPGELLASTAMSDLLLKLSAEYDYVLVDAPPLLPVADAVGLAPMTDGVLLAVRYGRTQRQQLRQAATALRRVGAKTLGVVLTMVPAKADIAAARGYGYGYDPIGPQDTP